VISLYTMERGFKNAGMGFNDTTFVGCNIVGFDNKRATPNFPPAGVTMKLAPVLITSGVGATVPDQVSVLYGSQPRLQATSPSFRTWIPRRTAPIRCSSTNRSRTAPATCSLCRARHGENCSIMEVTADQREPDHPQPHRLPRRRGRAQPEIQPGRRAGVV